MLVMLVSGWVLEAAEASIHRAGQLVDDVCPTKADASQETCCKGLPQATERSLPTRFILDEISCPPTV